MFQFILITVFYLALGVMLYLIVRALPRVEEETSELKPGAWTKLIASDIPGKIDSAFIGFSAKFLRRFKVVVLKLDNWLTKFLEKTKEPAKKSISFAELNGNGKSSESGANPADSSRLN